MRTLAVPVSGCLAALCGCAAPRPDRVPSAAVCTQAFAQPKQKASTPGRIVLPPSYRLVLLEGDLALVRETGEAAGSQGTSPADGVLPGDIAAELASQRARIARIERALESVMERSRVLSQQAASLENEARHLSAVPVEPRPPSPTASGGDPHP